MAQSEERGGVAVTFWQLQTTASRWHISHMLQKKRTEDLHDCPHWHSGAAVLHSAAFLLRCPKADGGSCLVDGGATCDACRRLSSGHENVVRLIELPLPIGIVVVVTICAVGHFSFAETFCGAPAWTGSQNCLLVMSIKKKNTPVLARSWMANPRTLEAPRQIVRRVKGVDKNFIVPDDNLR